MEFRRILLLVVLASALAAVVVPSPAAAEFTCTSPLPQATRPYIFDCGINAGIVGVGTTIARDCLNVRAQGVLIGFWVIGDNPCPA